MLQKSLLTTLPLYKNGFYIGKYISLEEKNEKYEKKKKKCQGDGV